MQKYKEIIPVIDKWIEFQAYMSQIPAVSIGIAHQDIVLLDKQYGIADLNSKEKLNSNHLFCCGSHSKMFTAMAIMLLHQKGDLDIHKTVNSYIPWFRSPIDTSLDKITILHLITHTAGIITDARLSNGSAPTTVDELKKIVGNGISTSEPMQKIKYSNFGYSILGCIIEDVSRLSYDNFIIQYILSPLEMKNSAMGLIASNKDRLARGYTKWYPGIKRERVQKWVSESLQSIYTSVGGLVSNSKDLLKFWSAISNNNGNLFSEHVLKEIYQTSISIGNHQRGIGFDITDLPTGKFCHIIGGTHGYHTQSGILTKQNLVFTILTTTTDAPVNTYSKGIIDLLNLVETNYQDFQSEEELDYHKFEGLYECPYGVYYISQVYQKLVIFDINSEVPAMDPIILEPVGENKFISRTPLYFIKEYEPIEFKMDDSGEMNLYDSLGRLVKRFTYDPYFRFS
ncbi:MAG: beta-lactamase family protein [Candidatus Heimdallarchaeota archaeon]|nr:beta-lactamase family protein [Candidatus Heimdallarchaeota archaeon]